MANTFDGRMYRMDTAAAYNVNGGNAITSDSVVVSKIRWVSATTAGNHCRISDISNNTFWEAVASGAQYVEESNFLADMPRDKRTLNGIRLVSLSSGVVYLYKE